MIPKVEKLENLRISSRLSLRAVYVLKRLNIHKVAELMHLDLYEIRSFRNVGEKTYREMLGLQSKIVGCDLAPETPIKIIGRDLVLETPVKIVRPDPILETPILSQPTSRVRKNRKFLKMSLV
jgi:hypothetical protein